MPAQGRLVIQLSVVEQGFEPRLSASTPPCYTKMHSDIGGDLLRQIPNCLRAGILFRLGFSSTWHTAEFFFLDEWME